MRSSPTKPRRCGCPWGTLRLELVEKLPKPKDYTKDYMAAFYPVSAEANAHLVQIEPKVFDRLSKSLPPHQRDLFLLRLQRHFQDLYDGVYDVYGHRDDFGDFLERLALLMANQYAA